MNVGIFVNDTHDSSSCLNKIYSFFNNEGIYYKNVLNIDDLSEIDILLVLGGDGTILMFSEACAKQGIKLLGVNFGHLGFLTEFENEKLLDALNAIKIGNYNIQSRTLLNIEFNNKSFIALNDVVVQRCTNGEEFANTISIQAEIDGSLVDNYKSDGLIISTPTGSTAYSLSAGGSVLSPDINAFIMTPICAHSLHSRPIVYNDNSVLKLHYLSKNRLNVIVDGKCVGEIKYGETLIATKSKFSLDFITVGECDFYNKLLMKLNIWSK